MQVCDGWRADQSSQGHTAMAEEIAFGPVSELHRKGLAVQHALDQVLARLPARHQRMRLAAIDRDLRVTILAQFNMNGMVLVAQDDDPVLACLRHWRHAACDQLSAA